MYRVVVPPVVAMVTVWLVMQLLVLQMVRGAAGDAAMPGSGPFLGLLEDLVKRNSIEVVQPLMVLLVLRIVGMMHRVMVLLVMPMVSSGGAMGGGAGGDAGDDDASGYVKGDGGVGNADGQGAVDDATGDGAAGDADVEGAIGDAPGDGEADDARAEGAASDATGDGAVGGGDCGRVGGDALVLAGRLRQREHYQGWWW